MNIDPIRLSVALVAFVAFVALAASSTWAQTPVPPASARVIVKYRSDSPLLRREALAAGAARLTGAQALGERTGLALRTGADVADRTQVLFASGMSSRELAARLSRESDIEFAVPDQRRHRVAAPNDPLYVTGRPITGSSGGPPAGQWYLRAPSGIVQSSIDVEPAWIYTTGSPGVVVAVLDTGVRYDHADLRSVAAGGNLLSGYDMIADVPTANDGDGRDADASDPGDWLTLAEVQKSGGDFEDCSDAAESSSWHGTQTSGLIAALTGNGTGMASVARNVRVLPVRVLGKCGGYDSDIIAGMRWAVGLPVPGVPSNINPARVLNLSLGGEGTCEAAYLSALPEILATGAVIVAAAGNTPGHPVWTPANCPGVIAVAGLRHAGTKVGFSALGPEITVSAPAGNCVNTGANDPCLYPILTTTNPGATGPTSDAAGGSIYTDSFDASIGTSFSAPLVAGTAALMLSAQPSLSSTQVRSLLQATARPFPSSGGDTGEDATLPQCTVPQFDGTTPIDQDQCYCTTAACGAGMLDAGAAVIAALGLQAHASANPSNPVAGQTVSFSAQPVVAPGRSVAAYRWEIADGGGIVAGFSGATSGPTATIAASAAGTFSVRLTVTDTSGLVASVVTAVNVAPFVATLNFQGTWWNAPGGSESGWGINFAHQGDTIFATWFTHDANGRAWQLSMTLVQTGTNAFAGTIFRTLGPPLDASPFDPALVQRIPAGSATLTFSDATHGTFAYTVNGISQVKSITPLVFGTLPTCTWGALADLAQATNYQDTWWAAPADSESGWGINFAHQGDTLFVTWFTFDFDGAPMSISGTLTRAGQGVYTGALVRTSGPPFNAVPFNPSLVVRTTVGMATVTFTNGNAGTFSYQVAMDGKATSQTKAITRLVFRPPGTACH